VSDPALSGAPVSSVPEAADTPEEAGAEPLASSERQAVKEAASITASRAAQALLTKRLFMMSLVSPPYG